jgi:hypothetical protein
MRPGWNIKAQAGDRGQVPFGSQLHNGFASRRRGVSMSERSFLCV